MEGELEALRGAILDVLAARSLPSTDDLRAAITACRDPDRLKRWLRLAATAAAAGDLHSTTG